MARTPATEYFGAELRRAREAAGLSREEFGRLVNYAPSTIGAFEIGDRFPSLPLAVGADEHLRTDGQFARMHEKLLTGYVHPDWFRPWPDIEQHASIIRSYEPDVVLGLLQIEAYARAVTGDDDAAAARLVRQQIFRREQPPEVVAIMDEAALHRQVGSRAAMYEQVVHLTEVPACVQIVPFGADTYLGVDGSFVLATVDGRDYVYVHTPARGFVLDGADIVSEIRHRWDVLRGEALPPRQSRELILKAAEAWQSES